MKNIYLIALAITFTMIVGALQTLINSLYWDSLTQITDNPPVLIGVIVGFVLLIVFMIYCLREVKAIDERTSEKSKQEIQDIIDAAFIKAGLIKTTPAKNIIEEPTKELKK